MLLPASRPTQVPLPTLDGSDFKKPMPVPDTPRTVNTPPQSRQSAEGVQTTPSPGPSSFTALAEALLAKNWGIPRRFASTSTQTPLPSPPPRINHLKRKLDEVSYDYEEVVVVRKPIAALPRRAIPLLPSASPSPVRSTSTLPPAQSHTPLPPPTIPYATRPTPLLAAPTPPSTHAEPHGVDAVLQRSDDVRGASPVLTSAYSNSATSASAPTLVPTPSSPSPPKSSPEDFTRVLARVHSLRGEADGVANSSSPSSSKPRAPSKPSRRRTALLGMPTDVGRDVKATVTPPRAPSERGEPPRSFSFAFSQRSLSIKVSVGSE